MSEILDEIIDQICSNIAEGSVEEAIEYAQAAAVNAGQETLVGDLCDQAGDQVEDIAEGEFEEVESSHPEAVGEISEIMNEIMGSAAQMCQLIRDSGEIF